MPSHIDPSKIPGDDLDPDTVDTSANQMRMIGIGVTNQGATVLTSWQAISGSYEAPESATLFSVMNPVSTNAEQFGSNLGKVADALNNYAEAVRPIKAELASLKVQASNFVSSIQGGVSHTSYSRAGAYTSTESWDKDQTSVDKNNDLINKVNAQMVLLWAAERECANKIYDTIGWSHINSASKSNPNGYGVDKIPDGAKMPWGSDVKRTESCGEKAADSVGHFVWNGVIVGGAWGTIKGLGTLVLGYNPADGSFFHGSTYGAAWSNLGMLGVGLLSVGPLGGALSFMPGPVGDFVRKGDSTLLAAGKGLIAYDEWSKDPATAAGTAVFNVGTILLPGGAETDGVKAGTSAVAATMRVAGHVAELADPVSTLVKIGATGMKAALPTLTDLTKSLGASLHLTDLGDLGKVDLPKIEIPTAPDHGFTFTHGDGVPSGSSIDVPKADIPPIHATVDAPPVSVTVHAGDHEPVLVGSGSHGGGDVTTTVHGGDGDSSVTVSHGGGGDSSVSVSHGGGDASGGTGSHGGGDTPTGPGDHAPTSTGDEGGRPWTPEDGDPALSGASHGDGWTRIDDVRGNPVDPDYGLPRADHGHLADAYAPPALKDVPEPVRSLVTDPGAPYGRDLAGDPYTRAEWEDRYIKADDTPRYPGNDGAVPGTRVDFTSVDDFQAHYGDLLDRMGSDNGAFMSFPDTPFEMRGLPGSNLSAPYSTLELTGHLPEHVHIEVSEVAPAFGQPGGGLQVRFIDDLTHEPIPVRDLGTPDYNVLNHVDDATATSVPHVVLTHDEAAAAHDASASHDASAGHDVPPAHDPAALHDPTSSSHVEHLTTDPGAGGHDGGGSDGLTPIGGAEHDPVAWSDDVRGVSLTESQLHAATVYLHDAQSIEPHVTATLQHIETQVPGAHLVGLKDNLKGADSFYGKVATDIRATEALGGHADVATELAKMKDMVRYTFTVPPTEYVSSVHTAVDKMVESGFTPIEVKNTWGPSGYQGINSWWKDESGHTFEMQFHTPESFVAKTDSHPYYAELRAPGTPPEAMPALVAKAEEFFAPLLRPEGASAITWPVVAK